MKIHPLADVHSQYIGENTVIWQFAIILKGAVIGSNCNINCHTFIENDVIVGNNVTVKAGVFLWDGIKVEDNVFIGPNASFTNDKFPRSKASPVSFQKIVLEEGCSIGANSTVLGNVRIGKYSIVGAGSVVTKDVPANALVVGNPARIVAWLDEQGNKLKEDNNGQLQNTKGQKFLIQKGNLVKI